jgi:hypothetical protein
MCIREILLSGTSYTWSENPLPWLYSIMRNYRPFLTEAFGKDPLDKGTSTSTATELDINWLYEIICYPSLPMYVQFTSGIFSNKFH